MPAGRGTPYDLTETTGEPVSLETRLAGSLNAILGIYHVPPEIRKEKIERLLTLDYRGIGRRVLKEFKTYVDEANDQALDALKNNDESRYLKNRKEETI